MTLIFSKITLSEDEFALYKKLFFLIYNNIKRPDLYIYLNQNIDRLKENIKPIPWALDKIQKINGVTFDWKPLTEEQKIYIHGHEGSDIGVIAQEIEKVLPEVVTTRDNGYKAVKYEKIVALLIEAIKEQQSEIDQLKDKING